jgi:hypothetical protein
VKRQPSSLIGGTVALAAGTLALEVARELLLPGRPSYLLAIVAWTCGVALVAALVVARAQGGRP